jgi:anti-anti-sigma factor
MTYPLPTLAALDATINSCSERFIPEGCTIWSTGGLPVVSLPAEVDIANAELLRDALLEVCVGPSVVIADMSSTSLLTAAAVGVLAPIGKRLHDDGGELRLVVRSERVRLVLDVLKLDQLFPIFSSLPEAVDQDCGLLRYGRAA